MSIRPAIAPIVNPRSKYWRVPTSGDKPEMLVFNMLNEKRIQFTSQEPIFWWKPEYSVQSYPIKPDFHIPTPKIIIRVQGVEFHKSPVKVRHDYDMRQYLYSLGYWVFDIIKGSRVLPWCLLSTTIDRVLAGEKIPAIGFPNDILALNMDWPNAVVIPE